MTSAGAVVLSLLVSLVLLGVLLAALHLVISSAVERGIRRSLTDSSLRPSFWELRRQQQRSERDWSSLSADGAASSGRRPSSADVLRDTLRR